MLPALLAVRSSHLRESLATVLREPAFPPHPRFIGKRTPILGPEDSVVGICVVYVCGDWVPVVCGVSRAGKWKCGNRRLLDRNEAFSHDILEPDVVEAWIIDAWRAVRHVAPELRGFVSEHDTSYMTDMDTGRCAEATEFGVDYL
jgi:hypothetical protein